MFSKLQIYCEAIMEASWLAAAVIIPLFFNVSSSQTFEPDKAYVLTFLAIISGAACMLKRLCGDGPRKADGASDLPFRSMLRHKLVFPVLALAAIYTLSSLFSIAPLLSWMGLYKRAQGTITFYSYVTLFLVILSELRTTAQLKRLQHAIILASLPVAGYGILQYFGADFLPWSNPMGDRSSGSMGNPIFLGAYLVMVMPLTFSRLVDGIGMMRLRSVREAGWMLAGSCGLALVLQAFALLYTQSRGPVIGLAVASYVCLFLFLTIKRSPGEGRLMHPALAIGAGILAPMLFVAVVYGASRPGARMAIAGLALALVLLAVGYWTAWRTSWGRGWLWLTWLVQAIVFIAAFSIIPGKAISAGLAGSPLARFTQMSGNSVDVRQALWQTGVEALRSGSPPAAADRFRFLRPVLGYGPENTWLIANSYATPDLVRLHTRETVDRMHNETFESLIGIGGAGAAVWVFLVGAAIGGSFRLLGFSFSQGLKNPFPYICVAGILAGVALPLAFGRAYLMGIGVPAGLLAGAIAFAASKGFRNSPLDTAGQNRQVFVLCVLGSITAHVVETAFGIAVTSTRAYFFILLAILAAFSVRDWRSSEEPEKKRSAKPAKVPDHAGLILTLVSCFAMLVIGWAFVLNRSNESHVIELFLQTWFSGRSGPKVPFPVPGSLLLLLLTLVGGIGLIRSEFAEQPAKSGSFLKTALRSSGLMLAVWLGVAFLTALFWTAGDEASRPTAQPEARMVFFFIGLLLLMLAIAWRLAVSDPGRYAKAVPMRAPAKYCVLLAMLAALSATHFLVLRPLRADVVHRIAGIYEKSADKATAIGLYSRASDLAPHVAAYWISKGLAQAATTEPAGGWDASIQSLRHALSLNPLDVNSNRTLASIYMNQAERSGEPDALGRQLREAIVLYEAAIRLAPNHPDAYCGMGRCYFLLGDHQKAAELYEKSLQLNPYYARTHLFLGEMHFQLNQLELAQRDFSRAAKLDPRNLDAQKNLGFILGLAGRKEEALRVNLGLLPRIPNDTVLLCRIAALYFSLGDFSSGHTYARRAYDATPAAQRGAYEQFVADLQPSQ
jgi:tetratricopeptide (TPR) repeat protein